MSERSLRGLGEGFFALLLCLSAVQANAQERDTRESHPSSGDKNAALATTLPDAPSANQSPEEGKQTKRIFGIIPNFRAVSVDTHLPPQTPKEKFVGFAKDSFDYSSFIWMARSPECRSLRIRRQSFAKVRQVLAATTGIPSPTRQMRTCG
jgi:hypothetical protein